MTNSVIEPGTVVGGDFEIVSPLAEGGMGVVYVARQRSIDVRRALKVMRAELSKDDDFRRRFLQEAQVSSRIPSGHIIQVIGSGIDEPTGSPWIAMELLEGSTLEKFIEANPAQPVATLKTIWSQLSEAIVAAHKMGIVHRDLKPENIYIARSTMAGMPLVVKVLDFGIAKALSAAKNSTILAGSPLYMAPEQSDGRTPIHPYTDIWALGLIAFFLLTGRHFWLSAYDNTTSPQRILRESVFETLPRASQRAAEYNLAHRLPGGFDAWFARMVSRDPAERFSQTDEACQALLAILDNPTPERVAAPPPREIGTSLHIPTSFKEQVAAQASTGPAATPDSFRDDPTVVTGQKGPPKALIAGAVGVLALGALGVGLLLRPSHPTPTTSDTAVLPATGSAPAATSSEPAARPAASPSTALGAAPAPGRPGMKRLGGATFEMSKADDKTPAASVTVKGFSLDETEVTLAAYRACVDQKKCTYKDPTVQWEQVSATDHAKLDPLCNWGHADRDKHPMNCVTFTQASEYCTAMGKRLPTEAEWELAASGGKNRPYPWGDADATSRHGNYCDKKCMALVGSHLKYTTGDFEDDSWAATAPVGSFAAGDSPEGIHDLSGNVWEWTSDARCPEGARCSPVLRGGGCFNHKRDRVRSSSRLVTAPESRMNHAGFRCAMTEES